MGNLEVESDAADIVYTVTEAARRLKVGRTTMYELISTGEVGSVTIGRLRRVPAQCIEEYLTVLINQSATLPAAA
jgi:excisionase family DNA binding protein